MFKKTPVLLIGDYADTADFNKIKKSVIESHFSSISQDMPMCRFRGTIISSVNSCGDRKILGWQRNVSRIRKMDVSLPTMIELTINDKDKITGIELDASFRGSKGWLCSRSYLNDVLKEKMTGLNLTTDFLQVVTLKELHCFHLVEVLNGIYGLYAILKNQASPQNQPNDSFFEEEIMDCYMDGGDCYACSKHWIKGRDPVIHTLKLNDIFRVAGFDKKGNLKGLENVKIDFSIKDRILFNNEALLGNSRNIYRDFLKFILKCIDEVKLQVINDRRVRFLNTNLMPAALAGLIVQAIAMKTFKSNYSYVMHVLTALQRVNDIPLCLGAIKSKEEAEHYFKGYDFENLLV